MTEIIFNRKEDEVAVIAPSSGCQNGKEKLHAGINLLERILPEQVSPGMLSHSPVLIPVEHPEDVIVLNDKP